MFGSTSPDISPSLKAQERFVQQEKSLPGWIFFSDASELDFKSWRAIYANTVGHFIRYIQLKCRNFSLFLFGVQFSGVSLSLPRNVHLLTLEPWKDDSVLVRFEHILEPEEDIKYSNPVSFNLKDVLHHFDVTEIRETTLAANQWLTEAKRMKFRHDDDRTSANVFEGMSTARDDGDDFVITLKPMQIRTFVIYFKWKSDIETMLNNIR